MSISSEPAASGTGHGWKKREFLILSSVTYGIVCLVTILAAIAYYKSGRSTSASDFVDGGPNTIAVGSLWVPLYPSAVLSERSSAISGDVMQSSFRFKTKDSGDTLFAFYKTKLKGGRFWTTEAKRTDAGGTIQAITHGGKARISVVVTGGADGSEAVVSAVEKVEDPLEAK